eukprot:3013139-Pleurochrysis_carterae.AAC.2
MAGSCATSFVPVKSCRRSKERRTIAVARALKGRERTRGNLWEKRRMAGVHAVRRNGRMRGSSRTAGMSGK